MSAIAQSAAPWRTDAASRLDVRVTTETATIADAWDALDSMGAGSIYQSRPFLEAWIANAAPALGIEPRLGLVHDECGEPIAFLPFGLKRRGPLRAVMYLGGRDANLLMPLLRPGCILAEDDAQDILRLFAAAMTPRPDVFVLTNQPQSWHGVRNPFAFAQSFASPSAAFGDTLGNDIGAFLAHRDSRDTRKKLRSKAARLATLGQVTFARATPEQAPAVVETFIRQKMARLATRGIDGGLDNVPVRAFLTAIAAPSERASPLEFHTLQVGDTLAALFGGLHHGRHWHGLINSYTDDPAIGRCSPGDLLLRHILADLVAAGVETFDLGIGEARYKMALCEERIELVDTIVPVTPLGYAFAGAERLRLAAKRRIKQTPWALRAVRKLQVLAGSQRVSA